MRSGEGEAGRAPENIFEKLGSRPAPELDSGRLWHRVEAQLALAPRAHRRRPIGLPRPRRTRGALRPAYALAATLLLLVAVWAGWSLLRPALPGAQFILLGTPESEVAAGQAAAPGGELVLDVRLVRGFDGTAPDDVRAARELGVGGADPLQDVRARIENLMPYDDFGVVGAWQGSVASGSTLDVELSDAYRLVARAADIEVGDRVRLDGIELGGAPGGAVSGDLTLEPGRLNILGVLAPGAQSPELVLLVRARLSAGAEGR